MPGMGFGFSDETREVNLVETLRGNVRAQELALEEAQRAQERALEEGRELRAQISALEKQVRVRRAEKKHEQQNHAQPIDMDAFLVKPPPEDSPGPGSTYNGAVVDPLPVTKADEQAREKKWAELREEFVRTNDPVTLGAMLQQVTSGLTPAERTNKDIAAYLARKPAEDWLRGDQGQTHYTGKDGKPAHPHYGPSGNQFLYAGAECAETCPCWEDDRTQRRAAAKAARKEARCKNYPCGLCGKRHPDDPCPLEWMRGDPLGELAPAWPPLKRKLAIAWANWKRIPVVVQMGLILALSYIIMMIVFVV